MNIQTRFPNILQDYFYHRLINQKNVSSQTVNSYRDTFKLLLTFMDNEIGIKVNKIKLSDIHSETVLKFLDYLEKKRKNCVRTRNARLAAIRSFLHYAALKVPTELPIIEQVLAIPLKRFDRPLVGYLTRAEINSIIDAPDSTTWNGLRDRVLFSTLYNTGARVSEIINVRKSDLDLSVSKSILLHGKGRKERNIPLWKSTLKMLDNWQKKCNFISSDFVFPNQKRNKMTRSGVENRLKVAIDVASKNQTSLQDKKVSPHVIRHTTAMHLLQSGVDITVIALWLGHDSVVTTHHYIEANLAMKEEALNKLCDPGAKIGRYKAEGELLAFLNGL